MITRPFPPDRQGKVGLYASLPAQANAEAIVTLLIGPEFKRSGAGIYVDAPTLMRLGAETVGRVLNKVPLDEATGTRHVCLQFQVPYVDHRQAAAAAFETALVLLRPDALLLDTDPAVDPNVEFERWALDALASVPWCAPHAYGSSPGRADDYFLKHRDALHRIARRFGKGVEKGRRQARFAHDLGTILRQAQEFNGTVTDAVVVELVGDDDVAFLTHCRALIDGSAP